MSFGDEIRWDENGLVAAIAQDADSGRVLMFAWMDQQALKASIEEGRAVYWSRSRQKLWRKGEESGNMQTIREIRIDCDADAVLLLVEQRGGIACHTGRERCFYRKYENGRWIETDPVLKEPSTMYSRRERKEAKPE